MLNLKYSFYSVVVWSFMVTDLFPDNLGVSQQIMKLFFFFIIQTVKYLYNNIHKKQRKINEKSIVPWEKNHRNILQELLVAVFQRVGRK